MFYHYYFENDILFHDRKNYFQKRVIKQTRILSIVRCLIERFAEWNFRTKVHCPQKLLSFVRNRKTTIPILSTTKPSKMLSFFLKKFLFLILRRNGTPGTRWRAAVVGTSITRNLSEKQSERGRTFIAFAYRSLVSTLVTTTRWSTVADRVRRVGPRIVYVNGCDCYLSLFIIRRAASDRADVNSFSIINVWFCSMACQHDGTFNNNDRSSSNLVH